MSHFVALVLVAGDTKADDVQERIGEALAKFNENLEVPEYDRKCWCVGKKAESDARDIAGCKCGTIDVVRANYGTRPEISAASKRERELQFSRVKLTAEEKAEYAALDKFTSNEWAAAIAPFVAAESEARAAHPLKDAADPECDECHGSGTVKSTRNPLSKWDWWVIGGRWAGWVRGIGDNMPEDVNMFENAEGSARAKRERQAIKNNARHVSEFPSPIPDELIPWAIVTPDGEWHEKGSMGWFGMSSGDKPEWKDGARAILAQHPTALAVAVDLHI